MSRLIFVSLLVVAGFFLVNGERHISVGRDHACKTTEDQGVVCFGDPAAAKTQRFYAQDVHAVTVGDDFSCALHGLTQNVTCWGDSALPEVAAILASLPTAGPLDKRVLDFAAGSKHLCVLYMNGVVECYGDSAVIASTPPPTERFRSISSGNGYSCSVTRADGRIRCWGDLSISGAVITGTPLPSEGSSFVEVACGDRHASAITFDGRAVTWGDAAVVAASLEASSNGTARYSWLTAGNDVTCGVAGFVAFADRDETDVPRRKLECWGTGDLATRSAAVAVLGHQYDELSCGFEHCFGLTSYVYDWYGSTYQKLLQWGAGITAVTAVDFSDYSDLDEMAADLPAEALAPVFDPASTLEVYRDPKTTTMEQKPVTYELIVTPSVRGVSPRFISADDMAVSFRTLSLFDDWDGSCTDDTAGQWGDRGASVTLQFGATNFTAPLKPLYFLGLNPAITYLGMLRGRMIPPPGWAPTPSQPYPRFEILPGTFNASFSYNFLRLLDFFKSRWCTVDFDYHVLDDRPPEPYPSPPDGGCRIKVSRGSFHGLHRIVAINPGSSSSYNTGVRFSSMGLYTVDYGLISWDFLEGIGFDQRLLSNASLYDYVQRGSTMPAKDRDFEKEAALNFGDVAVDSMENDWHHILPMAQGLYLPQVSQIDFRYQGGLYSPSPVYDYGKYGGGKRVRRLKIHEGAFAGLCRMKGTRRVDVVDLTFLNVYTETAADAALDARDPRFNGTTSSSLPEPPVTFSFDVLRGMDSIPQRFNLETIIDLSFSPRLQRVSYSGPQAAALAPIVSIFAQYTGFGSLTVALERLRSPVRENLDSIDLTYGLNVTAVERDAFLGFTGLRYLYLVNSPKLAIVEQYTFTRPRHPVLAAVTYTGTPLASYGCPAKYVDAPTVSAVGLKTILECAEAPPGSWSPGDGSLQFCPPGTYSDLSAQSTNQCDACPQGRYNALRGQSSLGCKDCPSGTASSATGATSLSFCQPCGKGRYSNQPGLSVCFRCPAGKWLDREGAADSGACTDCALNTYSEVEGATSADTCKRCPNGGVTLSKGTSSPSGCLPPNCPAGYGSVALSSPESIATEADDSESDVNSAVASGCGQCAPGYYSPGGPVTSTSCLPCPLGKFSDEPGSGACTHCPVSKVCVQSQDASAAQAACKACPYGTRCTAERTACAAVCPMGTVLKPGAPAADPSLAALLSTCSDSPASAGNKTGTAGAWKSPLTRAQQAKYCTPCGASLGAPLGPAAVCLPGISQPLVSLDTLIRLSQTSPSAAGRRLADDAESSATVAEPVSSLSSSNSPDCGTFVRSALQEGPSMQYSSQRVKLLVSTGVLALLIPLALFLTKKLSAPSTARAQGLSPVSTVPFPAAASTIVVSPLSAAQSPASSSLSASVESSAVGVTSSFKQAATTPSQAPPPVIPPPGNSYPLHDRLRDTVAAFDVFATAHVPKDDGIVRSSPTFTGGVFTVAFIIAALGLSVTVLVQLFGNARFNVSVSLTNLPPLLGIASGSSSLSSSSASPSALLSQGLHYGTIDAHFLLVGPTLPGDECPGMESLQRTAESAASNWTAILSQPVSLSSPSVLTFFGLPSSLATLTPPGSAQDGIPACRVHYRCDNCRMTEDTSLSFTFPQEFQSIVLTLQAKEAYEGCGPTTTMMFPSPASAAGVLESADAKVRVSPVNLLFSAGATAAASSGSSSSSSSGSSSGSWFSSATNAATGGGSPASNKPAVGHDLAVMLSTSTSKEMPQLMSPGDESVTLALLFEPTPYATQITATEVIDPLLVMQTILGFVSGLAAAFAVAMRVSEYARQRIRSHPVVLKLAIKRRNRCCLCFLRCLAGNKGVENKVRVGDRGPTRPGGISRPNSRKLQGSFVEALRSFGIPVNVGGTSRVSTAPMTSRASSVSQQPRKGRADSGSAGIVEMGSSPLAAAAAAARANRKSNPAAAMMSKLGLNKGDTDASSQAPRKGSVHEALAASPVGASSTQRRPHLEEFDDDDDEGEDEEGDSAFYEGSASTGLGGSSRPIVFHPRKSSAATAPRQVVSEVARNPMLELAPSVASPAHTTTNGAPAY